MVAQVEAGKPRGQITPKEDVPFAKVAAPVTKVAEPAVVGFQGYQGPSGVELLGQAPLYWKLKGRTSTMVTGPNEGPPVLQICKV
jgi:hypothetical protein